MSHVVNIYTVRVTAFFPQVPQPLFSISENYTPSIPFEVGLGFTSLFDSTAIYRPLFATMRPENLDDRMTEIESVVQSLLKVTKDSSSKADQHSGKNKDKTSDGKVKKTSHDEAQKNPNSKVNKNSDGKFNRKSDSKVNKDSVDAESDQQKLDKLNARWQKKMDKLNASWQEKTEKLNAGWQEKIDKNDASWYEEMHTMDTRDQEQIEALNAQLDHVDETIIPRLKELCRLNRKSKKFEDLHGISPWEMLCYRELMFPPPALPISHTLSPLLHVQPSDFSMIGHDQQVLRVLNDVAILKADKEYFPTPAFEESFEDLLETLRKPEGWKGVDQYHKESPERKAFDAFDRELKDALKELGVDGGEEDMRVEEEAKVVEGKKVVEGSQCRQM